MRRWRERRTEGSNWGLAGKKEERVRGSKGGGRALDGGEGREKNNHKGRQRS